MEIVSLKGNLQVLVQAYRQFVQFLIPNPHLLNEYQMDSIVTHRHLC